MIPVVVRDGDGAADPARSRRRRFGLDAPLPADPRIVERAILRHIAECRPAIVVLTLARTSAPSRPAGSGKTALAAGVPDLLLLLPGGRAAFLAIKTQAQDVSRAQRAFADLCRERAVPLHVVRSLPEARQALDRLETLSSSENQHACEKDHLARRSQARRAGA